MEFRILSSKFEVFRFLEFTYILVGWGRFYVGIDIEIEIEIVIENNNNNKLIGGKGTKLRIIITNYSF